MMHYTHIRFAERQRAESLITELLNNNTQFAVALDPQDLNAPRHVGWIVSYPVPAEAPEVAVA